VPAWPWPARVSSLCWTDSAAPDSTMAGDAPTSSSTNSLRVQLRRSVPSGGTETEKLACLASEARTHKRGAKRHNDTKVVPKMNDMSKKLFSLSISQSRLQYRHSPLRPKSPKIRRLCPRPTSGVILLFLLSVRLPLRIAPHPRLDGCRSCSLLGLLLLCLDRFSHLIHQWFR
jgi:hypothetical protein